MDLLLISFLGLLGITLFTFAYDKHAKNCKENGHIQHLVESLLAHMSKGLRESTMTSVLLRSDGTLSRATLIGPYFISHCTWPMKNNAGGSEDPSLLCSIDGHIELAGGSSLRKYFDPHVPKKGAGEVICFTIEADGNDDAKVRKQHGFSCRLELQDKAGTTLFATHNFIVHEVLKTSTHDRLMHEIFVALRSAITHDLKVDPA